MFHERSTSVEGHYTRRTRRQRQGRLPAGLRSDVARLRRDDLANDVLSIIFDRVEEIATRDGALRRDPTLLGRVYVPAVHERCILRELDADVSFRGQVRRLVREHLRAAHTLPPEPDRIAWVPRFLPEVGAPRDGGLVVRSSVGMGTSTSLDAAPEELDVYVHDRIVDEWRRQHPENADGLDEPTDVQVYVFGAAAGGFARVVESRRSDRPHIFVCEADLLIPAATNLPCVVGPRNGLPEGTLVDHAYAVLRSPGLGGAIHHGRIYTEACDDPSTEGPTQWRSYTRALLQVIASRVTVGGTVLVVTPESVRTDMGFRPAPELRIHPDVLGRLGLQEIERYELREVDPVNQPFVAKARPLRTLIIAKKTTGVPS